MGLDVGMVVGFAIGDMVGVACNIPLLIDNVALHGDDPVHDMRAM